MAEKRRFNRIPVHTRIKEIDQNTKGESNLLNISAFGAKIETTNMYRAGDVIKFSYIPPGSSLCDLEIENKPTDTLNNPTGMVKERIIKGKVVWVANHPSKASYYLVGLKYSPQKNGNRRMLAAILILTAGALGAITVTRSPDAIYYHVNSIVEWCSSLYDALLTNLFHWLPF